MIDKLKTLRGVLFGGLAVVAAMGFVIAHAMAAPATATYGDWRLVCPEAPKAEAGKAAPQQEPCRIFQGEAVNEGKKTLLLSTIFMAEVKGKKSTSRLPVLRITTPLAVALAQGLAVKLDTAEQITLTYQVCLQGGCMAQMPPDNGFITKMKSGKKLLMGYKLVGDEKPTIMAVSLKGLGEALDALDAADKKSAGK
jgi:invasion protein IalB